MYILENCSYQDVIRILILAAIIAGVIPIAYAVILSLLNKDKIKSHKYDIRLVIWFYMVLLLFVVSAMQYAYSGINSITIVEFCRKLDSDGDDMGYIVIRNNGKLKCEVDDLFLSDSEDNPKEYDITGQDIKPMETKSIFFRENEDLNFRSKGGSTLFLTRRDTVIDSLELPELHDGQSYIYTDLGWEIIDNSDKAVDSPIFSKDSGFYSTSFLLQLNSPDDCDIYYTLDGSIPSTGSIKYEDPIKVYDKSNENNVFLNIQNVVPDYVNEWQAKPLVDKAFIVRAACIDDKGNKSDIITKSYFVGLDEYEQCNVISLVADPNDLFGDSGIYSAGPEYDKWYSDHMEEVLALPRSQKYDGSFWDDEPEPNWEKKGIEWEREAYFTYFDKGKELLSQPVGIRIQGHGWGRYGALKRFSIFSRKQYSGNKYFDKPLFGDEMTHSMVLRQGDFHALVQMLVSDRDVVTSPVKRVSVFLNGEFWYDTYMLEKANSESLLSNTYNVNKTNISIVKNGQSNNDEKGSNPFSAMYDYISNNSLKYEEEYSQFSQIIDIQSYIDSTCIQVYIGDTDYQEKWNNYLWHTIEFEDEMYGDTRWRWGLYDMDNHALEFNPFKEAGSTQPGPLTEWPIYSSLRANDDFCMQFVLTFMDILNTDFKMDNVMDKIEDLQITDESISDFFKKRADYALPYLQDEFGLTGSIEVVRLESNRKGKPIKLNTISPIIADGYWEGLYYTDYPITISVNEEGFDHWEVTVNGKTSIYNNTVIELPLEEGGVQVYAAFE